MGAFGSIVLEVPNTSKMEPSWGSNNTTPNTVGATGGARPFVSNDRLQSNVDATVSGSRGLPRKNLILLGIIAFVLWRFWPGR